MSLMDVVMTRAMERLIITDRKQQVRIAYYFGVEVLEGD
jgi:hypothetical protein